MEQKCKGLLGYFMTELFEPSENRLLSRSAPNEGCLFRGSLSFLPAVLSLIYPVVFQAVGKGMESAGLSLLRQIFCLLPSFYLLSRIGLAWCWLAFPIAEVVTAVVGSVLYFRETKGWKE